MSEVGLVARLRSIPVALRLLLATGVIVFGGAAIWVLLISYGTWLPGIYPREVDRRVMRLLAAEVERHLEAPDLPVVVDQLGTELSLDLMVVDADGRQLAQAGHVPNPPSIDELQLARSNIAMTPSMEGLLLVAPVGTPPRAFVINSTRSLVNPRFPWRLFVGFGFNLLWTLAVLVPVSRSITRPLGRVSRAAEVFGRGDIEARSGLHGDDELGRLGQTFDQMAERINKVRRAEKEFLANASHELKTPLARLRMALALVERNDPQVARRLDDLELELSELERMVQSLLTLNRLDLAPETLTHEPVELAPLFEAARQRLLVLDPKRTVTIRCPGKPIVVAERTLLGRALDNLLDNARRYTSSSTPIEIVSLDSGDDVRIQVVDHGPGVPLAEREQVFEPFARGAAARTDSTGSGLGLPLVRRIARAHQGDATLEETPGGGATAVLRMKWRPA